MIAIVSYYYQQYIAFGWRNLNKEDYIASKQANILTLSFYPILWNIYGIPIQCFKKQKLYNASSNIEKVICLIQALLKAPIRSLIVFRLLFCKDNKSKVLFYLDKNLKFYHGYNISLPRYAKLFHYDMMIIPRFSPTSPQPFSYWFPHSNSCSASIVKHKLGKTARPSIYR